MEVTLELPPEKLWSDFWKYITKQGISGLYKFPMWKQIRDGWAMILLGEPKEDDLNTLAQTTQKLLPFEVAQIMYYNPSAPALYMNLGEGNIFSLQPYNKTGAQILNRMKEEIDAAGGGPITIDEQKAFTNFLETSVRTLVILKLIDNNQYNAINYRVVLP
jgi:hypothetical protein